MGDIAAVLDSNGLPVLAYDYDDWGVPTVKTIDSAKGYFVSKVSHFLFKGYFYDEETGFYYLESRYYDPELARFISADEASNLDPETMGGLNLFCYCLNNSISYCDPSGRFPVLAAILCGIALVGMGLTIGGVASDNNALTAIGLSMVAVPALVSGGIGIAAGMGGATLTGIIGGVTAIAGIGSGLFASAEYQEAFTGNNWMLDAGISNSWYNGLMLATAAIATFGTFASSFCYNFNIKSVDKIGKLIPSNHPNEGFWGIRFKNARGALRSLEFQNHVPHGLHFQLNSWNTMHMSVKTIRRWTWFLTRM